MGSETAGEPPRQGSVFCLLQPPYDAMPPAIHVPPASCTAHTLRLEGPCCGEAGPTPEAPSEDTHSTRAASPLCPGEGPTLLGNWPSRGSQHPSGQAHVGSSLRAQRVCPAPGSGFGLSSQPDAHLLAPGIHPSAPAVSLRRTPSRHPPGRQGQRAEGVAGTWMTNRDRGIVVISKAHTPRGHTEPPREPSSPPAQSLWG